MDTKILSHAWQDIIHGVNKCELVVISDQILLLLNKILMFIQVSVASFVVKDCLMSTKEGIYSFKFWLNQIIRKLDWYFETWSLYE